MPVLKKVLVAKYLYGLSALKPVILEHLAEDINARAEEMRRLIAQKAITLLRNEDAPIFPMPKGRRVAYVGIGLNRDNIFCKTTA